MGDRKAYLKKKKQKERERVKKGQKAGYKILRVRKSERTMISSFSD